MKKKEIINIIAEEISNMFEQSRDPSEIVHNWVSSISMDNNILELCNILAPESMKDSGDRFSIDINIKNGQRYYNVTWGRKWATFRQSYGYGVTKLSVSKARTHLKNYYWSKAASDAHGRFCVTQPYYVADTDSYHIDKPKRRRLPKNWREDY